MNSEPLTPAGPPSPLEQGQSFPNGWWVAQVSPLVLEKRESAQLLRRTVVPLGPLLLGAFVIAASWQSYWAIKLAVWPVGFSLLGICGLGVLNLIRSVRRHREGVRLAVDFSTVTGYPEARSWVSDYFVRLQQHPRSSVKEVTLSVYRDSKPGAWARAKVSVKLEGGAALVGPDAGGEDAQWQQLRDQVLPAAAALGKSLGKKVVLDYPSLNQKVEVSW